MAIQIKTGVPIVILLGTLSAPARQDEVNPRILIGWQVNANQQSDWLLLSLDHAPNLASWIPHGDRVAVPGQKKDGRLEPVQKRLRRLIPEAVRKAEEFLPDRFQGPFRLWVAEDVPYAAKAFRMQLVLSVRALQQPDPRLLQILAHELHHVALAKKGFFLSDRPVLEGLLVEGTATWMNAKSGQFLELEKDLDDPAKLLRAFERISALVDSQSGIEASGLFGHEKWGYLVGCEMIRRIETQMGRNAWLKLLSQTPEGAVEELIQLYDQTHPAKALRLAGVSRSHPKEKTN